ncbi:MAG: MFS transporter [Acidobacteria bacterium]|nr:MFS transporter [Acidobacteriota bacterium]
MEAQRFAALRIPPYRRYFAANLLSMTADNIEHVISYWVIFQVFHSPTLAGFAVISHWVPFLLFSLHSGALADRYDCRKLIQISQALFMAASLAWAVLILTGTLQMWHALVILTVHGAAGVVGAPASQLIIHDMVRGDRLASAIRLNATSRYLAILLGPAIGGGLMVLLGPAWGLLANVFIYVPFSVFVRRTPYTGHGAEPIAVRSSSLSEIARTALTAGLDPRILTMIALAGASSFFVGNAFQAQMPGYAEILGTDDSGARYSILLAANAAGAIVGVLLLEGANILRPSVRTAIVCAGLWGASMGLFPMAQSYPVAVGLLVLAGIFSITFTSMAQTLVQMLAPARIRGTVVGLFITAMLGLRAGSGLTVGVLGAYIGIQRSLELSSLMVVVTAVALFVFDARVRRALAPGAVTSEETPA